ncbi:MAG: argininosuccinate lyase [Bacteroidetes bacterium]|nr:argininosuccinate lyase [Bacteroidota bacterium]
MKLWQKGYKTNEKIELFTVGNDAMFDIQLAKYDVFGSIAHARMITSIGLLTKEELKKIEIELKKIYKQIKAGKFKIEDGVEDVHSQIELMLTQALGETGKKIHVGRSRNDQVLVDLKLFLRENIKEITDSVEELFKLLIKQSEKYKDHLFPGYTHFQVAMPSSFGLWFGAYAESLVDDVGMLTAAYDVVNKNPLGSAAGYGSSFALNRKMTTDCLGFESLNHNVVYAQMTRGKSEKVTAMGMANVASTLAKLAYDMCLYMNQEFSFVSFPDELTTGSSIMPHKKNPDVFELIRARCNRIQSIPNELTLLTNNLPSGYHRDLQLTKEIIFPAIISLQECIAMTILMLENISIKKDILNDKKYDMLYSVESVNQLVMQGIPFRDAYKQVGETIAKGKFTRPKKVVYTHQGSIGNLNNDKIVTQFNKAKAALGKKSVMLDLVK